MTLKEKITEIFNKHNLDYDFDILPRLKNVGFLAQA